MKNPIFKILRFDPEKDNKASFAEYEVPLPGNATILDGLFHIHQYIDPSLAFRFSCRGSVCGSCAMNINDRHRLACETQVDKLGKAIKIRPLSHLPVIKDLVVDMDRFWHHYEQIKPYLVSNSRINELIIQDEIPIGQENSPYPPLTKVDTTRFRGSKGGFIEKENIVGPAERKRLDGFVECILCGLCFGSCPVTSLNEDYHGPAALLKLQRFSEDIRDKCENRLDPGIAKEGAWGCRNVFNCQEICPKQLRPARAINSIRRKAIKKTK